MSPIILVYFRFSCETCPKKFNRVNIFKHHSAKCAAGKKSTHEGDAEPPKEDVEADEEVEKSLAQEEDVIDDEEEGLECEDSLEQLNLEEVDIFRSERSLSSLRRKTRRPKKYLSEDEEEETAPRKRVKRKPGRPRKVDQNAAAAEETGDVTPEETPADARDERTDENAIHTQPPVSATITVNSQAQDVNTPSLPKLLPISEATHSLPLTLTSQPVSDVSGGLSLPMERTFSLVVRDGVTYVVDTATQQVLAQVATQ